MGLVEFRDESKGGSEGLKFLNTFPAKILFLTRETDVVTKLVHRPEELNYRMVKCEEDASCPYCSQGKNPSRVFFAEVLDLETGEHKLLSKGSGLGKLLLAMHESIKEEEEDEEGIYKKVLKIEKIDRTTFNVTRLNIKIKNLDKIAPEFNKAQLEEIAERLTTIKNSEKRLPGTALELEDEDELPDLTL